MPVADLGGCDHQFFPDVIERGEAFLIRYPQAEVSPYVFLDVARGYEAWWSASQQKPSDGIYRPELTADQKSKADDARQNAIRRYRDFAKRYPGLTPPWLSDVVEKLESKQDTGTDTYIAQCAE